MQWWCVAQGVPWTWEWRPYPGVWLFVAAVGAAYWWFVRRAPGEKERGRHPGGGGWFAAGLAVLWAALDWPLGALGAGYLASVHMAQFLLIVLVAPPLLLLGIPDDAWARLARRSGGGLAFLTHPLTALAVFAGVMALTHWPPVVDGLMATQAGNFALDTLWLASGVVFWWPVVAPVPSRPWLGTPLKMGYLVAATIVNTGVFAYITFSDLPLYATFELAPPVTGLTTREDQMVAGLLMKMGGAVILWTAISILFFRWAVRDGADDPAPRAPEAA